MEEELELLKEVKNKTLERIIEKFGKGLGDLKDMSLSIWDTKVVIYEEVNKIANRIFKEDKDMNQRKFDEEFGKV